MPLRDDHDAALARADALQSELDRERANHAEQGDRIEKLETELREARTRLEKAEATLGDIKPKLPKPVPASKPVDADNPPRVDHAVPAPEPAPRVGLIVGGICAMLAISIALVKCAQRSEDNSSAPVTPTGPARADDLMKEGLARVESDLLVEQVDFEYVRADGLLDPQYGRMSIKTRRPKPPKPADDPNRPTGAPEPPDTSMMMGQCPGQSWSASGGWGPREAYSFCMGYGNEPVGRPRCTPSSVLGHARADGAPEGLARISVRYTSNISSAGIEYRWRWSFSITDRTRDVDFSRDYDDSDCPPPPAEK